MHAYRLSYMYIPQSELASVGVLADFDRGLGRVRHGFWYPDLGLLWALECTKPYKNNGFLRLLSPNLTKTLVSLGC